MALATRADRHRPLDRPHGHRLLLGRRGDRRRQRHPRRPRAGDGVRAQARARPPRARGEHPRRLAAVHDRLARASTRTSARRCSRTSRRSSPRTAFVTEVSQRAAARPRHAPTRSRSGCWPRNVFVFGQCMEGTQFYGLFGMILSLYRQGKLPGIGTMFRYTLRDESNHIELFRRLLLELVAENPEHLDAGVPRGAARADARGGRARAALHRRLPAGRGRRPRRRGLRARTSTTSPTAGSTASASSRCARSRSRTRCRGWPS